MPQTDSDRLQKIRERKAQLEKQERAIVAREKEKVRKLETRRKIIIGGIAEKYIPEFQKLEPKKTNAENDIEFAPVAKFFAKLVRDKKLLDWFMEDESEPPNKSRK